MHSHCRITAEPDVIHHSFYHVTSMLISKILHNAALRAQKQASKCLQHGIETAAGAQYPQWEAFVCSRLANAIELSTANTFE